MTDKPIIKQLAERYKEMRESPFADGYTFKAFEGRCAEQGFTIDDVRNYIEKEKQERKAKRTESIKSLKEQLKLKEQECKELKSLLKVRIEDLCDSCGASSMMPMPCKVYEKTLIEIKEIIKQGVKIHDDIIVSKQILQKINECGVENA